MPVGVLVRAVLAGWRVLARTGLTQPRNSLGYERHRFLRIYCKIYGFIVWDSWEEKRG